MSRRQVAIELVVIEKGKFIPQDLEFGKFYYSEEYQTSNHLCLCGCGHKSPVQIKEGHWSLNNNGGKLTVSPSFRQRFACESHYIINNGIGILD